MEQRWRNIICEITRAASSTGYCARYVTEAIRAGGRLKLPNTRLAKDMGRTLVNAGFHGI